MEISLFMTEMPPIIFNMNDENSIKFLASYSTAFIAPSLYQLYDGFSGNIDLNPESNETIEAGFEYRFKDWFSMDAVYFKRTETDAIVYDNSNIQISKRILKRKWI